MAASKTSSTPSPLKLEHSRYRRAPISRAAASPCCVVTKLCDFFRISSMATGSSRRSFLRPTRMIGTPAHSRVASSTHYSRLDDMPALYEGWLILTLCLTLSRESGDSTEKPTRITWALE